MSKLTTADWYMLSHRPLYYHHPNLRYRIKKYIEYLQWRCTAKKDRQFTTQQNLFL